MKNAHGEEEAMPGVNLKKEATFPQAVNRDDADSRALLGTKPDKEYVASTSPPPGLMPPPKFVVPGASWPAAAPTVQRDTSILTPDNTLQPPGTAPSERFRRKSNRSLVMALVLLAIVFVAVGLIVTIVSVERKNVNNAYAPALHRTAVATSSASRPQPLPATSRIVITSAQPLPLVTARGFVGPRAVRSDTGAPSSAGSSPTAAQLSNAVFHYYEVVPNNLDAGWNLLTPQFRTGDGKNRSMYDAYWGQVARVDVIKVVARVPDSAEATLRYYYRSGKVISDRIRFFFVRENGVLKISGGISANASG